MNDLNIPGRPVGKICPRFTAHDPIGQSTLYFTCKKEECSFWDGSMCAELSIAKALDRIAHVLEKRELDGK